MIRPRLIVFIGILAMALAALGQSSHHSPPTAGPGSPKVVQANRESASRLHHLNYQVGSHWPKWAANNSNTGQGLDGGCNGTFNWSYTSNDSNVSSPAIGSDGTLYTGGGSGTVYSLSPMGTLNWSCATGDLGLSGTAIGLDGTIYTASHFGTAYAVSSTGSLVWSYQTSTNLSAPSIGPDGTVYVGGWDGTLYAISQTGNLTWSYNTGERLTSSLAIDANGNLYASGNSGGVYCIDSLGNPIWSYQTGDSGLSTPSIGSDGTIYVGGYSGGVYSISSTGTLNWHCSFGTNTYLSNASFGLDGTIYVFAGNGYLYAVNPSGSIKWHYNTGEKLIDQVFPSGPAAISSDGTIYVSAAYGDIFAVRPNGSVAWKYKCPDGGLSSPAIGPAGVVYFGTSGSPGQAGALGSLYAIGTEVNNVTATDLSVDPDSVSGGHTSTGTVTLVSSAPPGGDVVTLLSSDPSVIVPPFVIVTPGSLAADFVIKTIPVTTNTSVIITATSGNVNVTASLLVRTPTITTLSFNPSAVVGGLTSTGTVLLDGIAPAGGTVVSLSSLDTTLATVPATVSISAGANSATFAVSSSPVATSQAVTISAVQNGTTINTDLTINPANLSKVSISSATVTGGDSPNGGTVTLASPAPAVGATVYLSPDNACVQIPTSIVIPAGASSAVFPVTTSGVDASIPVTITATYGLSVKSCILTVLPSAALSVTVTPATVSGGSSTVVTGTVHLNGRAGPSGILATLNSSNTSAATVTATVMIPANAISAPFSVSTLQVGSTTAVTLSAKAVTTVTTVLTVNPSGLSSVSISPTTIVGGNTPNGGNVTLSNPAPVGGLVVNLSSSDASVTVPATATVSAGQTTASFAVTTSGVDTSTAVTVTATQGASTKTCVLTVLPAWILSVTLSPATVVGGSTTVITGSANLIGKAGPSGTVVTLTSSNTSAATVPATVNVAPGAFKATFTITSYSVTAAQSVTITGSALGHSATGNLTVNPSGLASVSISATSIVGGNSPSGGTVTLNGPAPAGGLVVNLSSNNAAVGVPASTTVGAGLTTASFAVTTTGVDASTPATITATLGTSTKICVLTVLPATVLSVTLSNASVAGGIPVTGTVHLNGRAGPSGIVVNLASSNTSAATVPATVSVPATSLSNAFPITTLSVSSVQSVTITASIGVKSVIATLAVNPVDLSAVTISATQIVGGNTPSSASVVLTGPAPSGGLVVSLSSSNPAVSVSGTAIVNAGLTSATFGITTSGVDLNTPVTITATFGATTKSYVITVLPASVLSVTLNTSSVTGGTPVKGTVHLNGRAGPSGVVVNLSSSNTAAATVLATATVPSPGFSTTFPITTFTVSSSQLVTITATIGVKSVTTTLTVN